MPNTLSSDRPKLCCKWIKTDDVIHPLACKWISERSIATRYSVAFYLQEMESSEARRP